MYFFFIFIKDTKQQFVKKILFAFIFSLREEIFFGKEKEGEKN